MPDKTKRRKKGKTDKHILIFEDVTTETVPNSTKVH